jgi:hypothetical protein
MPPISRAETWIDHSKPTVLLGADAEDQHFARVQVTPLEFGQFNLYTRCENGRAGTRIHARFTVQFLDLTNDRVVTSRSHECDSFRQLLLGTGNMIVESNEPFELSQEQLVQITAVRLVATRL